MMGAGVKQAPHQTACRPSSAPLASRGVRARMDESEPPSISPQDLYGAIGTAAASVLMDTRRSGAYAADKPHERRQQSGAIPTMFKTGAESCRRDARSSSTASMAIRRARKRHRLRGVPASTLAISNTGLRDGPSTACQCAAARQDTYRAGVASGRERSACGVGINSDPHRNP
jgi:hypothetical protein